MVRTEFAATNLVPQLTPGYLHRRELEAELVHRIRTQRFAAIAGISGTGKSETAVAVSNELADDFEMVIWVLASAIQAPTELHAIAIERYGHRINLFQLLRERSCLVVLDDLRINLPADEMQQHSGERSAILITRQSASEIDVRIPFLTQSDARTVLEHGQSSPCPDEIFDVVWATIGGHPLALRLMNAGVRLGSWEELPSDCKAIGEYPDYDRPQRFADRLLGRLMNLLAKELAFFTWCGSGRADRSFARRALSSVGLRKLEEACLLVADRNDVLHVHDIVNAAISTLPVPITSYSAEFNQVLDTHVIDLAFGEQNALNFLNFCQVHRKQLETLLRSSPGRSTCLYCLVHAWSDYEIDLSLLGDQAARALAIAESGKPTDIDISAVCESIEAIYRKVKHEEGLDAARAELENFIDVFATLATAHGISKYGRRTALHHQAKALRNLKRYNEAIAICQNLLAEITSPATKLLLARLLIFDQDKKVIEHAKDLLFELLEDAKLSPTTAEISVTLAAIETLGRWQLKSWFREALETYGDLVSGYIIDAAARGFDQAFVAFAPIGRELRYNNQAQFVYVFEQLPRRTPEEAQDDKERAAWGHILLSASEATALGQSKDLATEALQFYHAIVRPDAFTLQQIGHTLVLLGRLNDAVAVLEPVVKKEANPWNRYWLSKAEFGLGNRATALTIIDQAIADPKGKSFKATMHEHRWEIRKAEGDDRAIEDLKKAYEYCEDDKHKASLIAKLKRESAQRTP